MHISDSPYSLGTPSLQHPPYRTHNYRRCKKRKFQSKSGNSVRFPSNRSAVLPRRPSLQRTSPRQVITPIIGYSVMLRVVIFHRLCGMLYYSRIARAMSKDTYTLRKHGEADRESGDYDSIRVGGMSAEGRRSGTSGLSRQPGTIFFFSFVEMTYKIYPLSANMIFDQAFDLTAYSSVNQEGYNQME